jgi:hypothetical protein
MAIQVYPETVSNPNQISFSASKQFNNVPLIAFTPTASLVSPSSVTKKLVVMGITISQKYLGAHDADNYGVFVYRGSSDDTTKIIAHFVESDSKTFSYNFGQSGLLLNAGESISMAYEGVSGAAGNCNTVVTLWGYEL